MFLYSSYKLIIDFCQRDKATEAMDNKYYDRIDYTIWN